MTFFNYVCFIELKLYRHHQHIKCCHIAKHLSLYHFLYYGKNNFLNDIHGKNSLWFSAAYRNNNIIIMTSGITSLMKISFVYRRFISSLERKYLEILLNLEHYSKMSQNFAGLSPRLLNISIFFSCVLFCIQYEKYADLLIIISMTTVHKNNKRCLPVNNSMLMKKFHSQSQFGCIKLHCFFRKLLSLFEQGPQVTPSHIFHNIDPFFL